MRRAPISVLVVDDGAAFPRAARAVLGLTDDFAVVEVAASVAEALHTLRRRPVDLVLMDVNMEPVDGITGARQVLAAPGPAGTLPPVVVLCSTLPAGQLPAIPVELGVSFLPKDAVDPESLLGVWRRHRQG